MKHENTFALTGDKVNSQYGDLTGAIQMDCHNNVVDLYDLCEDNGFKTDKYFIIGFGFGESTTNGVGEYGKLYCYVLMVEKNKYGSTFDEIKDSLIGKEVKVLKKAFSIPYSKMAKYLKRIDALLLTEMGENISSMKIEQVH